MHLKCVGLATTLAMVGSILASPDMEQEQPILQKRCGWGGCGMGGGYGCGYGGRWGGCWGYPMTWGRGGCW